MCMGFRAAERVIKHCRPMAITPSRHNGGSPAAGSVLSQHTHTESGCEMNEWREEDSGEGGEMDGGSEKERKGAETGAVGTN